MMTSLHAVILGAVQGLTEFLPVSSTGHLLLTTSVLRLSDEIVDSYVVAIQSGAILAVCLLFWRRFAGLLEFSSPDPLKGRAGMIRLLVTSLPAGLIGLKFSHTIKALLYSPVPVAVALGLGGLVMIWIEHAKPVQKQKDLEQLGLRQAFYIGCFQCLALWPGMSRSASTIIGARLLGFDRASAAEYSFLAAVPLLLAATAREIWERPALIHADLALFASGTLTAFVVALAAVKGFVWFLNRHTLAPFGWYRVILAALVILFFPR
jgi:undecaprenyl-diphosphatase